MNDKLPIIMCKDDNEKMNCGSSTSGFQKPVQPTIQSLANSGTHVQGQNHL